MTAPTTRQVEVLNFIRAFIARHGYPPTVREIGAHFGWTSTNAPEDMLRVLEKKGLITRAAGKARTIRVVSPQESARPAGNGLGVPGRLAGEEPGAGTTSAVEAGSTIGMATAPTGRASSGGTRAGEIPADGTFRRPPPLSPEEMAKRAPLPPEVLAGALQDRITPASGRLLASRRIQVVDENGRSLLAGRLPYEPGGAG